MAWDQDSLMQLFIEQLQLLAKSCLEYDIHSPLHGVEIAHRLRVLLHQTQSSHSIIHQLNIEQNPFISTASERQVQMYDANGTPAMPAFSLLKQVHGFGGAILTFYPVLDEYFADNWLPFNHWWNGEIVASAADQSVLVNISPSNIFNTEAAQVAYSLTRKDLVLRYSNKLGGSHLDPNIDALSEHIYKNEIGTDGMINHRTNKITGEVQLLKPEESPFLSEIRQIAHELFISLRQIPFPELHINERYFERIRTYRLIGHNKDIWDSGASSEKLLENVNNAITTVISFNNKAVAIGLSHTEPDLVSEYLQYEFCILAESDGRYCAMERGRQASDFAPYAGGDVFGFVLSEVNQQIKVLYLHNDKVIYSSKRTPVLPLILYCAMKHMGAQVSDTLFHSYKQV